MTPDEAIAWWYGRIDFERKPAKPGDLKLDRMRALLRALGDPHQRLRIVHVAGTKGKGSTSAMLASVLRAAGYRVGLFTSPHLTDVCERIQIDNVPISREELAARMVEVAAAARAIDQGDAAADRAPTFFEVGTALGFLHFVCRQVDVAIVEVGLGGRFDSTNVCHPLLSIITNISFDHMAQLGDRIHLIAREKAGIIKPRRPVVTTADAPEALEVIEQIAREKQAPLCALGRDFSFEYRPGRVLSTEYAVPSTACRVTSQTAPSTEYAVPSTEYRAASQIAPSTENAVPSMEYPVVSQTAPSADCAVPRTEHRVGSEKVPTPGRSKLADPDSEHINCSTPGTPHSVLGTRYSVLRTPYSALGSLDCRPPQIRVQTQSYHGTWMDLGLFGRHQAANAAGVVAAVEALRKEGLVIDDTAIAAGLANVQWPARLEIVGASPLIILDCAHNVASAQALVDTIRDSFAVTGKRRLVFAVSNDKQAAEMLEIFAPYFDSFYLTRYGNNPRCLPPETAASMLRRAKPDSQCSLHMSAAEALDDARAQGGADGIIVIAGSVFLAGELRPLLVGS